MNYYSLNQKLKNEYGCKVYKLALDGGFTCPNRDGTLGTRGCIFCLDGSGAFSEKKRRSVTEQIELAKKRVSAKTKDGKYIAYFQSYTATYADPEYLERLFTEAINHPDVLILSIGTRPDCLGKEVLSLLSRLTKIKPVWVELGLQTTKEESVRYIRRGYQNEVYKKAVRDLHDIGVEVITHVILGLPGESREDMKNTVRYAVDCGTDGIKLQLLHVLSGTDLEKDYKAGKFKALEMDEYIDILCDCLSIIPKNVVIHRLTGDGDKKNLVAPLWSVDKKRVLSAINEQLKKR
ncbi:MAG: TIGR01212 family radical SAM protein [Clostridia bacterium]|nr:TIGR01212 family radical SAM protein [Clostridia bacterium]